MSYLANECTLEPGIYEDLEEEAYFEAGAAGSTPLRKAASNDDGQLAVRRYMADDEDEDDGYSAAKERGTMLHAAILEGVDFTADEIADPRFERYDQTTYKTTKTYRQWREDGREQVVGVRPDDQEVIEPVQRHVEGLCKAHQGSPSAHGLLRSDDYDRSVELSAIWHEQPDPSLPAIACRLRWDLLVRIGDELCSVDLKTTRHGGDLHALERDAGLGWKDLQPAHYERGWEQAAAKFVDRHFWLVCKTSEPYTVHLVEWPADWIQRVRSDLNPLYRMLQVESCPDERPAYAGPTHVHRMDVERYRND